MTHQLTIELASPVEVIEFLATVPDFAGVPSHEDLARRLASASTVIALKAVIDGKTVGVKLGYNLNVERFYSWLGAVAPSHRRTGVATRLLLAQERLAQERGFASVQVKSMNKYPAMVTLLLKHGYLITGTEDAPKDIKILFYKQLVKS